ELLLMHRQAEKEVQHVLAELRSLILVDREGPTGVGAASDLFDGEACEQLFCGDEVGRAQVALQDYVPKSQIAALADELEQVAAASEVAAVENDQASRIRGSATAGDHGRVHRLLGAVTASPRRFESELSADE